MPTSFLRRLAMLVLVSCAAAAAILAPSTGPVAAHNTLLSSDPADGATLDVGPSAITWNFDKPVPLDSMTVTLIDVTGARTELAGSTHGAAGDSQVITPLPRLDGEVSVRWRLVGADGHPITGRVTFTIAATSATPTPGGVTPSTSSTGPSATIPSSGAASPSDDLDEFSTPSALRWMLRYGSYLAIMAVVGILLTSATVWADAGTHPLLRRILSGSLLATAGLGFAQLMVIASDIAATPPWSALGEVDPALVTNAGMAFAARIVIALALWLLLFRSDLSHPDVYWSAVSLPALGLLATWAFAGHSASMRWPTLGVLTDVAHHAAAAAWIAGLAIVGWIVIPAARPDVLVPVVHRFSRVASVSVAVLVVTGIFQTMRLVGSPGDLFAADHGRYLVAKLAILAGMLALANVNRRRVDRQLDDAETVHEHVGPLRNAMLAEFAIGLVIIAVTAAMVVSPPAISDAGPATTYAGDHVYYIA
jgi:copper transport protein